MSDTIELPRDVVQAICDILDIASDWNAPTHYDITPPKGWDDTRDPDSHEPDWVALYLFAPKLRALLAQPDTGKE